MGHESRGHAPHRLDTDAPAPAGSIWRSLLANCVRDLSSLSASLAMASPPVLRQRPGRVGHDHAQSARGRGRRSRRQRSGRIRSTVTNDMHDSAPAHSVLAPIHSTAAALLAPSPFFSPFPLLFLRRHPVHHISLHLPIFCRCCSISCHPCDAGATWLLAAAVCLLVYMCSLCSFACAWLLFGFGALGLTHAQLLPAGSSCCGLFGSICACQWFWFRLSCSMSGQKSSSGRGT